MSYFSLLITKNIQINKFDQRLTLEKKEAIAYVLNAKTVEEVFQFGTAETVNINVLFKKMSLLVHPDKNLHLNATEASKVVNHAYKELRARNPTAAALKISNLATESKKKPPKVCFILYIESLFEVCMQLLHPHVCDNI